MITTKEYYKFLDEKAFPVKLIYKSVYSLTYRLGNYKAGNPCSRRIRKDIFRRHLFTEREALYKQELKILSDVLDKYNLHEGYHDYARQTTDSCLTDMMSAQFINRVADVIENGEYKIIGKPQNSDDNRLEGNYRNDE